MASVANTGLLEGPLHILPDTVKIHTEGLTKPRSPGPRPFGRPSKEGEFDGEGWSDHFPISAQVADN